MTVSTTGSTAQFLPNGVNTSFPFSFRFFAATDLKVFWQKPDGTIQLLVLNSNYTVQGVGNDGGGSITTIGTPLPNGLLVVSRIMVATQLTSFRNQGEFFAEIHEDAFDKLVMLVQQTIDSQSRGLTVPLADPLSLNLELPGAVSRSGKVLAFDEVGQPVSSNLSLAQIEQQPALALESAAQAEASALAALGYRDSAALSAIAAALSELMAQKWAENPEDSAVTAGLFSAHHWANKAAATALTTQKQIQEITATVASNALTLGWVKTPTSFRAASLSSGVVNTRNPPSNLSLVVPSGATLGTSNGVLARLMLLEIDNAGTVELAVCNVSGGNNLDEAGLISTIAISSGSTSANVIYSAVARSNVPFRVAGFIELSQAAAGTWATAPSRIQGAGGQAVATNSIGNGQTWVDVTGSRAYATNYVNTTGRPMIVSAYGAGSANGTIALICNGVTIDVHQFYVASAGGTVQGIIPPGATYRVDYAGTGFGLARWVELR